MIGCQQDEIHHPEGDAWQHTLATVDAAAVICSRDGVDGNDRTILVIVALLHDIGKPLVSQYNDEKQRITAYAHGEAGIPLAMEFMEAIGMPEHLQKRVVPLVAQHMRHVSFFTSGSVTTRVVRRLARDLAPSSIGEWTRLVEADHNGRPPLPNRLPPSAQEIVTLADTLNVQDAAPKPIVMGRHLIKLGLTPGPEFGHILRAAFEAQLDGKFQTVEGWLDWYDQPNNEREV